jgi:hypothetical protein
LGVSRSAKYARTSLGRLNRFLRIEELAEPYSSKGINEEDRAIRLAEGHFKWELVDENDDNEEEDMLPM